MFSENGKLYCKLTGACRLRKGQLLVIFVAVRICFCGVLIESYELIQSYVANPQSTPFPQPHNHPFAVRHNLLSAKESASSSYKTVYPFVQGLEFAAVQIIAVDTVEKKRFAHSRLPDKSRSSYPKHRFDRRFEPFSESRGPQTSGVLLVLFVEAKRT